jgi:hypothetical protein
MGRTNKSCKKNTTIKIPNNYGQNVSENIGQINFGRS